MPESQTPTTERQPATHHEPGYYRGKHRYPRRGGDGALDKLVRHGTSMIIGVTIGTPAGITAGNLGHEAVTPRPVAGALPAGGIPKSSSDAAPRSRPEALPGVPQVPEETKGLCGIPEHMQYLLVTDCNLLSPITSGPDMPRLDIHRDQVGSVINDKGESTTIGSIHADGTLDADVLPDDYKLALRTAMTDPYVASLVSKYPVTLDLAPNNQNGYFIPGKDLDSLGSIRLIFNGNPDVPSSDSLYPTWGSIRLVLIHEGTHGDYNTWEKMSYHDTEAGQFAAYTIQQLESLHAEEVSANYHDTLEENADFYRMQLNDFANALTPEATVNIDPAVVQIIRQNVGEMISLIDDGRIEDTIANPDQTNQSAIYDRIVRGSGISYGKLSLLLKGASSDLLINTGFWYAMHVADQYRFMRDGSTTPGVSDEHAGHPGDATTEMMASIMVAVQGAPDKFLDRVTVMSSTHRERITKFLETIEAMYVYNSPELNGATNLRYVITHLRAVDTPGTAQP